MVFETLKLFCIIFEGDDEKVFTDSGVSLWKNVKKYY